jgi:hypothetical protein
MSYVPSSAAARRSRLLAVLGTTLLVASASCSDDTSAADRPGFLGGTSSSHEIGVVVNSTGKSVTLFQLGSPVTQKQIALGTSSTVTPTGLAVRGRRAAVPLGKRGSVALINLETSAIQRFFVFASGNATGARVFRRSPPSSPRTPGRTLSAERPWDRRRMRSQIR